MVKYIRYMQGNKKDHLSVRSTNSYELGQWGREMVFSCLFYTTFLDKIQGKSLMDARGFRVKRSRGLVHRLPFSVQKCSSAAMPPFRYRRR